LEDDDYEKQNNNNTYVFYLSLSRNFTFYHACNYVPNSCYYGHRMISCWEALTCKL